MQNSMPNTDINIFIFRLDIIILTKAFLLFGHYFWTFMQYMLYSIKHTYFKHNYST